MHYINIGILAHVDAGKTTVTEALLHTSGARRKLGRVDHGDTVADSLSVERERGITVRAATVSLQHNDTKINILDTPGHMDFIAEVERALVVLDAAILVVSAREGVQAQTKVLFGALQRLQIPTVFFINKLDRIGADVEAALDQIRSQLTTAILPRQQVTGAGKDVAVETLPLHRCADVVDRLFQVDDTIANLYMDGVEPTDEQLFAAYTRAIAQGTLYPVYMGVALAEIGIPALLDAIVAEMPAASAGGEDLSALVYKVEFHPKLGRLCYMRIYSGSIAVRQMVAPYGTEEPFRVTQLFTPDRGELRGAVSVTCGDIAVLPIGGNASIGSILGEKLPPVRQTSMAEPLLKARVVIADWTQRPRTLEVLQQLCMEDPLLDLQTNEQTGALELRVFGQVQMEVLRALAQERFGLELTLGEPQTIFRECPAGTGIGNVNWGESPFAAAIGITVDRLAEGSGIQYETKVDYGYLYPSFQNAVHDGLLRAIRFGLYGWQLTDVRITLQWAIYSSVLSTPADFRNVAPIAVIRALNICGTEILEPILRYSLTIPADFAGRATYDLGMMGGTMEDAATSGDEVTFSGTIPLKSSKLYAQTVASYTKGRGIFTVRAHGFARFAGDKASVANQGYEMPSEALYLLQKAGRMG